LGCSNCCPKVKDAINNPAKRKNTLFITNG
jgi:hypothetical protein